MSEPQFTYEDGNYLLELGRRINNALMNRSVSLDARFAEKFAANPGVVTRAEFEDLKREVQEVRLDSISILNGDLTARHTLDLRAEISKLDTRLKELEKASQDVTVPEPPPSKSKPGELFETIMHLILCRPRCSPLRLVEVSERAAEMMRENPVTDFATVRAAGFVRSTPSDRNFLGKFCSVEIWVVPDQIPLIHLVP